MVIWFEFITAICTAILSLGVIVDKKSTNFERFVAVALNTIVLQLL